MACSPQERIPSKTSDVPLSFKAGKQRKSLDFIRSTSKPNTRAAAFRRMPSQVSSQLVDDSEQAKVLAGVARLLFRYVAECGRGAASEWFDEEQFFRPRARFTFWLGGKWRYCCRRRRQDSSDAIFMLLRRVCAVGSFGTELVVLTAIYVERLVRSSSVRLSPKNWRPIVLAALLLASKVWEDIHPWNADYSAIVKRALGLVFLEPLSLYELESRLLKCLQWNASVNGEEYARYYFALCEAAQSVSSEESSLGPGLVGGRRDRAENRACSWCGFDESPGRGLASTLLPRPEAGEEAAVRPKSRGLLEDDSPLSVMGTPIPECPESEAVVPGCSLPSASLDSAELGQQHGGCPWWVDPRNPYIGTFRHAPRAEPPSKHIGDQARTWQAAGKERLLHSSTE